ncbi:MAG TPA: hypothetical protein DCO86_03725 [Spirochaetaceae bacterium]|nr:hypothetical protein [Spirochaetaceae bacterium]
MKRNDFVVKDGSESDKGFFARNIRIIAIAAVAVVLVVGIVLVARSLLNSKASAEADKAYEAYSDYYSLSGDSTQDDINKALTSLLQGEANFSAKSPVAVRINFYKADLYDRLGDADGRIGSLEKIVSNADSENYLLPIALYDLAVAYEDKGDVSKAAERYYRIYEIYGSESELSDRSLFALYRIYCQNDVAKANGYKKILEEEFKDSEYTKFLLAIGR